MDFYFANNLMRPDFECFLMELADKSSWKAHSRGYPHLSVELESMCLYLHFYQKDSEEKILQLRLSKDISIIQ